MGPAAMVPRRQRRWNVLALVAVLLALLMVLFSLGQIEIHGVESRDFLRLASSPRALTTGGAAGSAPVTAVLRGDRLSPAEEEGDQRDLEAARYKVYVGVYSTNNYSLDLRVPSYAGSGYVWMNWDGAMQRYLEQSSVAINQLVVPLNLLGAPVQEALQPVGDKPIALPGDRYYQLFSFQGSFYIDNINFRRFPFLQLGLPMVLEVNDPDGELGYGNLRLLPDVKESGMGVYADIIGWLNLGWSIAEYRHHYATNFGLGGAENDYSQVVFDLSYGTSAWSSFWRLLLPLIVVMAMVLLVFKLRTDLQDVRSSIPVTILLTLVFLQQAYRSSLPDLPYLTFLDQVYVVAYVLTLIAFVLVIWIGKRYADLEALEPGEQRQLQQTRLQRLDEVWPLTVVFVATLAIGVCWLSIPSG